MPDTSNFKNFMSRAILVALIVAAVVFIYTLFVPKMWQVAGKIVVVPSGSSQTAGQNLYLEAGNLAQMLNSPSFKKNMLGKDATNFNRAEAVANSSTVSAIYLAKAADVKSAEDNLVKFPGEISTYTRDLYNGAPFKYLLVSDPEVSASPASPKMIENVGWGFLSGFIIFFLYWLFFESLADSMKQMRQMPLEPEEEISLPSKSMFAPEPEAEILPEAELPVLTLPKMTKVESQPEAVITPRDMQNIAPENLPIAEDTTLPAQTSEPSDEEVKDRLNKLMRGEL